MVNLGFAPVFDPVDRGGTAQCRLVFVTGYSRRLAGMRPRRLRFCSRRPRHTDSGFRGL